MRETLHILKQSDHRSNPINEPKIQQPENVLLQADGQTPVLIDFGSMAAADRRVGSRSEALLIQEDAATNSTMPYRAPELFDVSSDAQLDARVDGASGVVAFMSTDDGSLILIRPPYPHHTRAQSGP